MGANATTFVPSYTSGEVLTAANLSVTNSGIPVFATTVTRDAAFGGTGEKTLAEGQFAYIEATNATQYYDGSAWQSVGVSPGMVLVKTQTIGTAVASVAVTDAFSATYENYKIIVNGGAASAGPTLQFILGSTTTGYYWGGAGNTFAGAGAAGNGANSASADMGSAVPNGIFANIEISSPNLANRTVFSGSLIRATTTGLFIPVGGYVDNATQYTGFTLTPSSGTLTGGTIRVYGYANS
jgi:hypothetical protein